MIHVNPGNDPDPMPPGVTSEAVPVRTIRGITPAKTPMEGGFSLDQFMPGLSPEDAEAFGKALETADLSNESEEELVTCLWCQGSTPLETVVGECCWNEWKHRIDDLAMLTRLLVRKVKQTDPNDETARKAMVYLTNHNL